MSQPDAVTLSPESIADGFAPQRAALIPMLTAMQRAYGYVSEACFEAAARHVGVSQEEIRAAVTFYPHLRFTPPARHLVRICQGTACHLRGAHTLRETAETLLGVSMGCVTADGTFALEPAACLGCCANAPAIAIGNTAHGPVEPDQLRALLDETRNSGA